MIQLHQIRNGMRLLAGASAVMLAMGAGGVYASTNITGHNDTTGPSSSNSNSASVTNASSETVSDSATADNSASVAVSTGEMDVNNNTTVGSLDGGSVSVAGGFDNDLNTGVVVVTDMSDPMVTASFGNDTTGPSSANSNMLTVVNSDSASINRNADIRNSIEASLETGGADVNNNTTVGNIHTGNVTASFTSSNTANTGTLPTIFGAGGGTVSVTGTNHLTGPSSSNTNQTTVTNASSTNVNSTASINNTASLGTSTGGVDVNNNTTVGNISTGNQTISSNVSNTANTGSTTIVGSEASTNVTSNGTNGTTGPNSSNSNTTSVTNSDSLSLSKSATINNSFSVSASSGGGDINNNTTVGNISTGGVTVNLSSTNHAN